MEHENHFLKKFINWESGFPDVVYLFKMHHQWLCRKDLMNNWSLGTWTILNKEKSMWPF